MSTRSMPIPEADLRGLHPRRIQDPSQIRRLLEWARETGCVLHQGLNADADLEIARIAELDEDTMRLALVNFELRASRQVFLNFVNGDRPYFFTTERKGQPSLDVLEVRIPDVIYYTERRDRDRRPPRSERGEPLRVRVTARDGAITDARVSDVSAGGMALLVEGTPHLDPQSAIKVTFLDGASRGEEAELEVRNRWPADQPEGWTRIGLVRSAMPTPSQTIPIDQVAVDVHAPPMPVQARPDPPWLRRSERIENAKGEAIAILVDAAEAATDCPTVILTNGWGQTKEALLPLASTIVSTFSEHGEPVNVIRFDGIRRRGESHNDPECRIPGKENLNYVFSQGVDDILTVARHARRDPALRASRVVLISFSAGAIEARKAIALASEALIDGWISVVGAPDLQSMARSISGGVDFVGGHERGYRFGVQELLGVAVDIDRIAVDAEQHRLSYIEDSRADLARIRQPITWLHGRYDGWVDLKRVQDVLSYGDTTNRSLRVVPTGHQLKSSAQAQATFGLIASESARMSLGRPLSPVAPNPSDVRRTRIDEAKRVPAQDVALRAFWRDYLIGRDQTVGIELLTTSSAYEALMATQIDLLRLERGQRVVDLGSGTGSFALALDASERTPSGLRVVAVDYVHEALTRARSKRERADAPNDVQVRYVEADLDLAPGLRGAPLRNAAFDAGISSLLLSYLDDPIQLLREAFRLIRPGGRLVVSSLRQDADISRLYHESLGELQIGSVDGHLPAMEPAGLSSVARSFLNDAARILELEESGAFHFWEAEDLADLMRTAGFEPTRCVHSLGHPPQAVVVVADRP